MSAETLFCDPTFQCCTKPTAESNIHIYRKDANKSLGQEVRKHWEISGHCWKLLIPTSYQHVDFSASSANYYYQLFCNETIPDQDLVKMVRSSYYRVLAKLNSSGLQVKNFILPVQLMPLKFIDPYSRQRILENICRFLHSQAHLRCVVLEQAGVTFVDLCCFLLSVARNSLVKKLYLFGVLDKCILPFKGPLQSEVNLDDLPRNPYTFNPGGRKYLRELKKMKEEKLGLKITDLSSDFKALIYPDALSLFAWIGSLLEESLRELPDTVMYDLEESKELLEELCQLIDNRDFVFTQFDVGVQCEISSSDIQHEICHIPRRSTDKCGYFEDVLNEIFTKIKIDCCIRFLKVYENSEIKIETVRKIYKIALNGLINLSTLSLNYKLLGDGTGDILLSIGSITKGKLKDLEILCSMEDISSAANEQYNENASHAVPDNVWVKVKKYCPDLKVRMVCLSMITNEVTKMFITKSIPLNGIHFDNGFCPTLVRPQIMFFKTVDFLIYNFKRTLEHVDFIFWHSSGRIDNSMVNLITKAQRLRSFEYHGPLQYMKTVSRMCDAALRLDSEIVCFKLMVQGDPCFPSTAKEYTDKLYKEYFPKFHERSINFVLGTHSI